MSRRRGLVLFVVAALFGLVASMAVVKQVRGPEVVESSTNSVGTAPIMLASRLISPGTQLSPDMVQMKAWPTESIPEGSFSSLEKAKGRVSAVLIRPGQPIVEGLLAPEGSLAGLGAIVPPGYRAVTVKVDDVVGVAGFISPGDRVDVLVTLDQPGESREGPGARVILQNVQVLAAGQEVESGKKDARSKNVGVMTLLVTPDGAEKLALASARGRIQLALRNATDETPALTSGVTARSMGPEGADKQRVLTVTLEVIRGVKREVRELEVNGPSPEPFYRDSKQRLVRDTE